MYLYHRVPNEMSGTVLYPLNDLKSLMPQIYSAQAAKYEGREDVMRLRVPVLECEWNDVLHLSPIHPQLVADGFRGLGQELRPAEIFEVPFDALIPAQTIILLFNAEGRETVPYTREALASLGNLPEQTLSYYRERFSDGGRPLLFAYTPHVLFRGTLETKNFQRVVIEKT